MKTVFVLLYLALLIILPFIALLEYLDQRPPGKTTILVVGDFGTAAPFGRDTRAGVNAAVREAARIAPYVRFEYLSVPDAASRRTVAHSLLRVVSQRNVAGMIVGSASQTAAAVAEVARTIRIPALFTVATFDGLTTRPSPYIKRLPARDEKQAAELTRGLSPGTPTVIVYDASLYSSGLQSSVSAALGLRSYLPCSVENGMSTLLCFDAARGKPISKWIVIGYRSIAEEFLARKRFLGVGGLVLLSDGCYGDWLRRATAPDDVVALTFPASAAQSQHATDATAHPTRLTGYAPFAHDAALLFAAAIRAAADEHDWSRLAARVGAPDTVESLKGALFNTYTFKAGENATARFETYAISQGVWP